MQIWEWGKHGPLDISEVGPGGASVWNVVLNIRTVKFLEYFGLRWKYENKKKIETPFKIETSEDESRMIIEEFIYYALMFLQAISSFAKHTPELCNATE
jgi:hypothetical protein